MRLKVTNGHNVLVIPSDVTDKQAFQLFRKAFSYPETSLMTLVVTHFEYQGKWFPCQRYYTLQFFEELGEGLKDQSLSLEELDTVFSQYTYLALDELKRRVSQ